jgi:hypothetical protein
MAGELTVEQLAGIAQTTLNKFKVTGKAALANLCTDVNEYIVLPKLMAKEKIKVDSGKMIERTAMTDHAQSFKGVGLHDENRVTIRDKYAKYYAPWRHVKVDTGWELHEVSMNSKASQIVDLIKAKYDAMNIANADGFERAFWVMPGADDGLLPYPLQYWVVRHYTGTSLTTGALNGGNNAWSVAPGGLTNDRYKNWTFAFPNYTADSLLKLWWRAFLRCRYKSPVPSGQMATGRSRYEFFVTTEGLLNLRQLAEDRNENLGYDLGIAPDGGIKFGGCPIIPVPLFDDAAECAADITYQSIYGLDWNALYWVFLDGWYMKQYGPKVSAVQRNSVELIQDSTLNLVCDSRRSMMLGSKV